MKKLILLALLIAGSANAALYTITVDAGDTLVGATEDTTISVLLYDASTTTGRCNNGSIWITQTEIGTNPVQMQLQVITDVACENLAAAGNGWVQASTSTMFIGDTDKDVCIPLPFLDGLTARYARWRISYTDGRAGDSTSYKVTYAADPGPPLGRPTARSKTILHRELKGSTAAFACNGTGADCTAVVDLRIETVPGWFQVPDRGWLKIKGGNKADDDSLTLYMWASWNGVCYVPVDTMTIRFASAGISGTFPDVVYLTPTLNGGAAFPEFARFMLLNEGAAAADTTESFMEITVEKNP